MVQLAFCIKWIFSQNRAGKGTSDFQDFFDSPEFVWFVKLHFRKKLVEVDAK